MLPVHRGEGRTGLGWEEALSRITWRKLFDSAVIALLSATLYPQCDKNCYCYLTKTVSSLFLLLPASLQDIADALLSALSMCYPHPSLALPLSSSLSSLIHLHGGLLSAALLPRSIASRIASVLACLLDLHHGHGHQGLLLDTATSTDCVAGRSHSHLMNAGHGQGDHRAVTAPANGLATSATSPTATAGGTGGVASASFDAHVAVNQPPHFKSTHLSPPSPYSPVLPSLLHLLDVWVLSCDAATAAAANDPATCSLLLRVLVLPHTRSHSDACTLAHTHLTSTAHRLLVSMLLVGTQSPCC